MNTATRYKIRASRLSHQTFDDETIIVDLDSGSYFSLNKAASRLWCFLGGPCTADDLAAELGRRYMGDVGEMQTAAERFLGELQQAELVETAGTHSAHGTAAPEGPEAADRPPLEPPALSTYTDMQELLQLDPIHEVDETGWPRASQATDGAD